MQNGNRNEIEELFATYADRMVAGETLDLRSIAAAHPNIGNELVEELRAFQALARDESETTERQFGEYSIIRPLGRGGMGTVYEAWQNTLERQVALKVLPMGLTVDSKAVARFIREAQVAAKLRHAHIVPVYGMGLEGRTPYYAMECVYGRTLHQVIKELREQAQTSLTDAERGLNNDPDDRGGTAQGGVPDLDMCLEFSTAFAGVAEGLQHAHSKGVVHRDIKPSNLIFGGDEVGDGQAPPHRLKILDFGLARLEGHDKFTASGDVIGTIKYMSPEQASVRQTENVDYRTDIYSLGATMYETLTLRPPFEGKDHSDTLRRIISDEPTPPRRLNPRIPRDLETIILKCMRKLAGDRYATAEALAQDLCRLRRGDPIEARPQSRIERIARRTLRYKWQIAVACVITFLTITAWRSYHNSQLAAVRLAAARYEPQIRNAIASMREAHALISAKPRHPLFIDPWENVAYRGPWNPDPEPVYRAIELLNSAIAACPERADAYFHRARCYVLADELDKAEEDLGEVLERQKDHIPARLLKESIRHDAGRTRGSTELLQILAEGKESRRWRHWLAAQKAYREGSFGVAAEEFQRALHEARDEEPYIGWSLETRYALSLSLTRDGQLPSAFGELARLTQVWPDVTRLLVKLEGQRALLGDTERALHNLEKLWKDSDNGEWIAATVCVQHSLAVERGQAVYNDELINQWLGRITENKAVRHWVHSIALRRARRTEMALRELTTAADVRRTDGELRFRLAEFVRHLADDPEAALPHYREAVRLSPGNMEYRAALIEALAMCNQTDEAADQLAMLKDRQPHTVWEAYNLGIALSLLGDPRSKEVFIAAAERSGNSSFGARLYSLAIVISGARRQHLLEQCVECPKPNLLTWPHHYQLHALHELERYDELLDAFHQMLSSSRPKAPPLEPPGGGPETQTLGRPDRDQFLQQSLDVLLATLRVEPNPKLDSARLKALLESLRKELNHQEFSLLEELAAPYFVRERTDAAPS